MISALIVFLFIEATIATFYCPNGWTQYERKCFWKDLSFVSRDENLENCKKFNANLVTIRNEKENAFVHNFIKNDGWHYWLSAKRESTPHSTFKWIDGSEIKFSNWKSNPTSAESHNNVEQCVNINTRNGLWYEYDCDSYKGKVVRQMCEKEALFDCSKLDSVDDVTYKSVKNYCLQKQIDEGIDKKANEIKQDILDEIKRNDFARDFMYNQRMESCCNNVESDITAKLEEIIRLVDSRIENALKRINLHPDV
ncbi:hypothetical protein B4U80_11908 [Leptotrombidium deliense]|uniref:C-type lectin domain-containing protein n=1 Tax=Leptotrombidium deliense TaxID=299467 RepID=A0A443S111_9ACAR|nr:hypothetical protein B4U80_11908 [Leptotrombidium deliense]